MAQEDPWHLCKTTKGKDIFKATACTFADMDAAGVTTAIPAQPIILSFDAGIPGFQFIQDRWVESRTHPPTVIWTTTINYSSKTCSRRRL